MTVNAIPAIVTLQNLTITGTQCFNATQTVIVAGGGTTFTVENGGNATIIAGQKISFLPGTRVKSGGKLHGYITTTGEFCINAVPSIPAVTTTETANPYTQVPIFMKVFPNPTNGDFVLELNGFDSMKDVRVDIYNMSGMKVLTSELTKDGKTEFSLSGKPSGIYLIQVISEQYTGTSRIIKR
jgi:hypothetical protein